MLKLFQHNYLTPKGESSVLYSGVPQDTLRCINVSNLHNGIRIACNMSLACRLFAGNCIIYRSIKSKNYCMCTK